MKKTFITFLLVLFALPIVSAAHGIGMMGYGFDGYMMEGYGVTDWLLPLTLFVWLVVGLLAIRWFIKKWNV